MTCATFPRHPAPQAVLKNIIPHDFATMFCPRFFAIYIPRAIQSACAVQNIATKGGSILPRHPALEVVSNKLSFRNVFLHPRGRVSTSHVSHPCKGGIERGARCLGASAEDPTRHVNPIGFVVGKRAGSEGFDFRSLNPNTEVSGWTGVGRLLNNKRGVSNHPNHFMEGWLPPRIYRQTNPKP